MPHANCGAGQQNVPWTQTGQKQLAKNTRGNCCARDWLSPLRPCVASVLCGDGQPACAASEGGFFVHPSKAHQPTASCRPPMSWAIASQTPRPASLSRPQQTLPRRFGSRPVISPFESPSQDGVLFTSRLFAALLLCGDSSYVLFTIPDARGRTPHHWPIKRTCALQTHILPRCYIVGAGHEDLGF